MTLVAFVIGGVLLALFWWLCYLWEKHLSWMNDDLMLGACWVLGAVSVVGGFVAFSYILGRAVLEFLAKT